MASLRVGVVGCGANAATMHRPALETNPHTSVAVACDPDEQRLAEFDGGDVTTTTELDDVVDAGVDYVHLCSPPQTHCEIAERLLSAGIPTLVEKPVAMDRDELSRIREAADATGATVGPVYNRIAEPPMRRAIRAVEEGRVGDVVSVTGLRSMPIDPHDYGGWIGDLSGGKLSEASPHLSYRVAAFLDAPLEVTDVQRHAIRPDVASFDGITMDVVDEQGRVATLKLVTGAAEQDVILVDGTDGRLRVTLSDAFLCDGTSSRKLGDRSRAERVKGRIEKSVHRRRGNLHELNLSAGNGHYVLIDAFATAVRNDSEPLVSLGDSVGPVRLFEAIERD